MLSVVTTGDCLIENASYFYKGACFQNQDDTDQIVTKVALAALTSIGIALSLSICMSIHTLLCPLAIFGVAVGAVLYASKKEDWSVENLAADVKDHFEVENIEEKRAYKVGLKLASPILIISNFVKRWQTKEESTEG